jgi:hypothetical protein
MVMWTTYMFREDLVDGDINLLHIEKGLSIMCSRESFTYMPLRKLPIMHMP